MTSINIVSILTCIFVSLAGAVDNCAEAAESYFRQVDVFEKGKDPYYHYYAPSLLVTHRGTVLAFCEGRSIESLDNKDVDVILKRSVDNGKTWGPLQVVFDDGNNTCGNICTVFDRDTEIIWLFSTHNLGDDHQVQIEFGTSIGTRTIWVMKSTDEGATWSVPIEITKRVKASNWAFYGTGPGIGIQLANGNMMIPCYHTELGKVSHVWGGEPDATWPCHIFYSDDHGANWRLGGMTRGGGDECQIVELEDGTIMMVVRDFNNSKRVKISRSLFHGLVWSPFEDHEELIGANCQASFIRYTDKKHHDKNRLLFSQPGSKTSREKMTVRLSYDEGKTWPVSKVVNEGLSGYSCLAVFKDGTIGCMFDSGEEEFDRQRLSIFNLEWLTDGADELPK